MDLHGYQSPVAPIELTIRQRIDGFFFTFVFRRNDQRTFARLASMAKCDNGG